MPRAYVLRWRPRRLSATGCRESAVRFSGPLSSGQIVAILIPSGMLCRPRATSRVTFARKCTLQNARFKCGLPRAQMRSKTCRSIRVGALSLKLAGRVNKTRRSVHCASIASAIGRGLIRPPSKQLRPATATSLLYRNGIAALAFSNVSSGVSLDCAKSGRLPRSRNRRSKCTAAIAKP